MPLFAAKGSRTKEAKNPPNSKKWPLARWEELVLAGGFTAAFFTFRGLYGYLPFLMSLGLGSIFAFLTLLTIRILTRPHVTLRPFRFRMGGKLLLAGQVALGMALVLGAFWAHSAVMRYSSFVGDRAFARTESLRRAVLDVTEPTPTLLDSQRADLVSATQNLGRLESWGLVKSRDLAPKQAWLHFLAGRRSDARREARSAVQRGEWVAEMERLLAQEALTRNDLLAAAAAFERSLAADKNRIETYESFAVALAQGGDLSTAAQILERGRSLFPKSPGLLYNMGLIRALRGESQEAIRLFQQVLTADPSHLPARENLAGVLAGSGRFQESAAQFRLALQQAPDDVETRFLLCRALVAAGEYGEAEQELRALLELVPGHGAAQAMLTELADRKAQAPAL